jgi:hypothetical protein
MRRNAGKARLHWRPRSPPRNRCSSYISPCYSLPGAYSTGPAGTSCTSTPTEPSSTLNGPCTSACFESSAPNTPSAAEDAGYGFLSMICLIASSAWRRRRYQSLVSLAKGVMIRSWREPKSMTRAASPRKRHGGGCVGAITIPAGILSVGDPGDGHDVSGVRYAIIDWHKQVRPYCSMPIFARIASTLSAKIDRYAVP